MSQVVRKDLAQKLVFDYEPKPLQTEITEAAQDFVERERSHSQGFEISEIVSAQSGVEELRKQKIETEVENTVLERMKEIEEQAYKQAYTLGLEEGTTKAYEDTMEALRQHLQEFDSLLLQMDKMKTLLFKENESALVKLTYLLAEKIAMRKIQDDSMPVVEALKSVIDGLQTDDQIEISLSQKDIDFIEELRKRKVKEASHLDNITLNPSPELQTSEFIVESNFGMIDASLNTRMAKVWETLKAKMPLLRDHKTDLKGKAKDKNESDDSDE